MNTENQIRSNIVPGLKVKIVLKKDQPTGILTEGVVKDILTNSQIIDTIIKDILTNSAIHPRGIKVRLETGHVGRVQQIIH